MIFKKTFIVISLVTIQLSFLVFTNTHQLITDYYLIHDEKDKTENVFIKATAPVLKSDIFKYYSRYTGTASGYGFFAPNVGSEFILLFSVYDDKGTLLGVSKHPKSLIQNESRNRFNMYTLPMMKRLKDGKNKLLNDYFNVTLHQIARNVKNDYENGEKVICEVFMYSFPEIKDFSEGQKDHFFPLEKYMFKF